MVRLGIKTGVFILFVGEVWFVTRYTLLIQSQYGFIKLVNLILIVFVSSFKLDCFLVNYFEDI